MFYLGPCKNKTYYLCAMSNVKESDLKNCLEKSHTTFEIIDLDEIADIQKKSEFFMNLVLIFVGFFMIYEIVKTLVF